MPASPKESRTPEQQTAEELDSAASSSDAAAAAAGASNPSAVLPAAAHAGGSRLQVWMVCAFLLLAVGVVFGRTVFFDFVDLDDYVYVSLNQRITGGLSGDAVKWAFTNFYVCAYTPVTWLSHMLDCQLYGLNAGGHHLTNVILHALTAVLLFLVLRQMTGRLWPSAFVAALFAVHPLRVESVAWITERKDVLNGFFFMLTLWAYVRCVQRGFSWRRYLLLVLFFALGLMSKPMVVTLPFVLLLLDYWPLGRFGAAVQDPHVHNAQEDNRLVATERGSPYRTLGRLVLEKVPLFAMALAFCLATLAANAAGTVEHYRKLFPLSTRIELVPVDYVNYLGMFFFPVGLAYPYVQSFVGLSAWKVLAAVGVLLLITAAAVIWRRKRPYLLVGWLWYLGMLVPVLGVMQFGAHSSADRFTYLPQIGLGIVLAWGLADSLRGLPYRRVAYGAAAAIALAALMGCTWRQTGYWRTSEALWKHCSTCKTQRFVVEQGLGNLALARHQPLEAMRHFQAAIADNADFSTAHYNLGVALAALGRVDDAIREYRETIRLAPCFAPAYNNLGQLLLLQGKLDDGLASCQEALRLMPEFAEAHYNVGNAYYMRGRYDDAIAAYRQAVKYKPDFSDAHYQLGLTLAKAGQLDAAIAEYRQALAAKSDFAAQVHNTLGCALLSRGQAEESVAQFEAALALDPLFRDARRNLFNARRALREASAASPAAGQP